MHEVLAETQQQLAHLESISVVQLLAEGGPVCPPLEHTQQDAQRMFHSEESAPAGVEQRWLEETPTVDCSLGMQVSGVRVEHRWRKLEVDMTARMRMEKLKTEGAVGKLVVRLGAQGWARWCKEDMVARPRKEDARAALLDEERAHQASRLTLTEEEAGGVDAEWRMRLMARLSHSERASGQAPPSFAPLHAALLAQAWLRALPAPSSQTLDARARR